MYFYTCFNLHTTMPLLCQYWFFCWLLYLISFQHCFKEIKLRSQQKKMCFSVNIENHTNWQSYWYATEVCSKSLDLLESLYLYICLKESCFQVAPLWDLSFSVFKTSYSKMPLLLFSLAHTGTIVKWKNIHQNVRSTELNQTPKAMPQPKVKTSLRTTINKAKDTSQG